MTADLKTVLADALQDAAFSRFTRVSLDDTIIKIDPGYGEAHEFEADRLATAIRDHFKNQRFEIFETVNQAVRGEITPERAADMIRLAYLTVLIEGLAAGGSSE